MDGKDIPILRISKYPVSERLADDVLRGGGGKPDSMKNAIIWLCPDFFLIWFPQKGGTNVVILY